MNKSGDTTGPGTHIQKMGNYHWCLGGKEALKEQGGSWFREHDVGLFIST